MTSKILLTLGTLIYGLAPLIADLNSTHVFHPEWLPHARFHMVWLLGVNVCVAALALYCLWNQNKPVLCGLLGICIMSGFWIAALSIDQYGGAFSDIGGIDLHILGLDGNVFGFGVSTLLLCGGLMLSLRNR